MTLCGKSRPTQKGEGAGAKSSSELRSAFYFRSHGHRHRHRLLCSWLAVASDSYEFLVRIHNVVVVVFSRPGQAMPGGSSLLPLLMSLRIYQYLLSVFSFLAQVSRG